MNAKKVIIIVVAIALFLGLLARGDSFSFLDLLRGDRQKTVEESDQGTKTIYTLGLSESQKELLEKDYPEEKRLKVLLLALQEGSTESLQFVSENFLKELKGGKRDLYPLLKIQALRSFLALVAPFEWENGGISSEDRAGNNFSPAKAYVQRVWVVNPGLATFLSQASPFFFRLYEETKHGRVYRLQEDLQNLGTTGAPSILPNHLIKAFPEDYQRVSKDLSFQAVFAEKQCVFTASYLNHHPETLTEHVRLLQAVDPRFCEEPLERMLLQLIFRLVSQASIKVREEILLEERQTKILTNLVGENEKIKRALSQLFLIGALDQVKNANYDQAGDFLTTAKNLYPTLSGAERLEELLRTKISGKKTFGGEIQLPPQPKTQSDRPPLFEMDSEGASQEVSENPDDSFVAIALVVVAIVGLIFVLFRILKRFRRINGISSKTREHPKAVVKARGLSEEEIWGGKPEVTLGDVTKNRVGNE